MAGEDATPANALKVSLEAGDLVAEFGTVVRPASSDHPAAVEATDRVVMPLDTARRLVYALEDALRPHAAALRAADAKALSPGAAAAATRPGEPPRIAEPAVAGGMAARLLGMVGELGVPYQHERSFRIAEGVLLANRFLLTISRRDLPTDGQARVLDICTRLGMPVPLQAAAQEAFKTARCLHFGFEGDADEVICKLYLERGVPGEEAQRARQELQPVLLHLAFKWNPAAGNCVTTRYWWHPLLPAGEIEQRLATLYGSECGPSLDMARAALQLATAKVAGERLQYLEVQEDENSRRSFDLNLYNAKLQVRDIQSLLYRMRERFAVRPGQFQALYDQIKGKSLGHLAGGVHRNGQDFFNVYYGVTGFPHFNERMG